MFGMAVLAMGLAFAVMGVIIASFFICGIGILALAQAFAAMIVGEMKLLPELLMDFDSVRWLCFGAMMITVIISLVFGLQHIATLVQDEEPSTRPNEILPSDFQRINQ